MIRYALMCEACEAGFEGWFSGSDAFETQREQGAITCPSCGGVSICKAIMAPALKGTKREDAPVDPAKLVEKLAAKARAHIANNFDYVGDTFADEARAIHTGEREARPIWGKTTPQESAALEDEGIEASPLPEPFTPPVPDDPKKLN